MKWKHDRDRDRVRAKSSQRRRQIERRITNAGTILFSCIVRCPFLAWWPITLGTEQIIRIPKSIFHNWSIAIKQNDSIRQTVGTTTATTKLFNTLNGNGVIVWLHHDYEQIDNVNTVIDSDSNKMCVRVRVVCGFLCVPRTISIFSDIHIPFISVPHTIAMKISYKKNYENMKRTPFLSPRLESGFENFECEKTISQRNVSFDNMRGANRRACLCQYANICFVQWPFANAKIM